MAPGRDRTHGLTESTGPADAQERRRALRLILQERRRLLESSGGRPDGTSDPRDTAQRLEEEQVWLAVLDYSHETQVQVDEAMRLLVEGRYGQCVGCGEPIATGRLRALPFALRCLACQEQFEAHAARKRRRASSESSGEQDDEG